MQDLTFCGKRTANYHTAEVAITTLFLSSAELPGYFCFVTIWLGLLPSWLQVSTQYKQVTHSVNKRLHNLCQNHSDFLKLIMFLYQTHRPFARSPNLYTMNYLSLLALGSQKTINALWYAKLLIN